MTQKLKATGLYVGQISRCDLDAAVLGACVSGKKATELDHLAVTSIRRKGLSLGLQTPGPAPLPCGRLSEVIDGSLM